MIGITFNNPEKWATPNSEFKVVLFSDEYFKNCTINFFATVAIKYLYEGASKEVSGLNFQWPWVAFNLYFQVTWSYKYILF